MLELTIHGGELYDEINNEFVVTTTQTLQLEHSLISLSKWESNWLKPFLHSDKTNEELLDYIKCMTLTENVDPNIYKFLRQEHVSKINDYIGDPMTATTFSDNGKNKRKKEIITNELIYYWMFSYGIPVECQNWHLNRLMTLIRVFSVKNAPPEKKRSQKELAAHYAAENARRKAMLNTKG